MEKYAMPAFAAICRESVVFPPPEQPTTQIRFAFIKIFATSERGTYFGKLSFLSAIPIAEVNHTLSL